jgi:hypothetical protein
LSSRSASSLPKTDKRNRDDGAGGCPEAYVWTIDTPENKVRRSLPEAVGERQPAMGGVYIAMQVAFTLKKTKGDTSSAAWPSTRRY